MEQKIVEHGLKIDLHTIAQYVGVKQRAARTARNPRTKEPVDIPAARVPVFKAGKALKDAIQ